MDAAVEPTGHREPGVTAAGSVQRVWAQAWFAAVAGVAPLLLIDAFVTGWRAQAPIGRWIWGFAVAVVAWSWLAIPAAAAFALVVRLTSAAHGPLRRTRGRRTLAAAAAGLGLAGPAVVIAAPWSVYDPYRFDLALPALGVVLGAAVGFFGPSARVRAPAAALVATVALGLDAAVEPRHFARLHGLLGYAALVSASAAAWWLRSHWWRRRALVGIAAGVAVAHLGLLGPVRSVTADGAFHGTLRPKLIALVHGAADLDDDGFAGVLAGGDCDDSDPGRRPGACEVLGDGIDANCNGLIDGSGPPVLPPVPPRDDPRRPDLYLVVVDTLRADFGGGPVPPAIARLAARSLQFTQAYTVYPLTHRAMTAFAQGRYWRYVGPDRPTLTSLFVGQGYDVQVWHGVRKLVAGERPMFRLDPATEAQLRMDWDDKAQHTARLIDDAIAEIGAGDRGPPRLRWIHLDDPHYPLLAGAPSDPAVQRYRGEVARVDRHLGRLLDALSASARGREAVVMLIGDHGEEFGEHGGTMHGGTLYEEGLRVPMLVRLPGVEPRRIDEVALLIDGLPTVLDYLGWGRPAGLQGVDWLDASTRPPIRVLAQIDTVVDRWSSSDRPSLRAVRDGRFKLVVDLDRQVHALYDLHTDPGETRSVAGRHPERVVALHKVLDAWQDGGPCQAPTTTARDGS